MSKPATQTFGKYQILERIATGGMAEIYKARLEGIGGFQRTFAIKRILPNLSHNNEYISMLVDEAKVAGLLSHANIVQILDLGQVDGIWYIAMEYVPGRDLGAILRRAKKKGLCLPVPHTVFIAIELLKGLEYAHQRQVMRGGRPVALNIIHRDVSPPNVLLSFQGEVKLTDFGIARASLKALETVTGIVKGRFDYMSPEQAAGSKDLDQRSDLFSVGVVLYELLTGHHPFRTDNEIGTIERVRTGRYVPVSHRNPEVPFTLETIVDRALQVDRDERYPSATAFKEALDKFFHDAGFIFTHATLASYVRGLFPEAQSKPAAAVTPNSTTVKQNRPGVDPAESPTRRVDRKRDGVGRGATGSPAPAQDRNSGKSALVPPPNVPSSSVRSSSSSSPATSTPGTAAARARLERLKDELLDADENETLIKHVGPPPAAAPPESDSSTALRPHPQFDATPQFDEAQTIIRRAEADEAANGSLSGSVSASGISASGLSASGSRQGASQTASSTGSIRRRQAPPPPRSLSGWAVWLLSPVALLAGLGIGVVVTAATAGLIAGYGYAGQPAAAAARIEILAPPGTQVLLNGEAVGKAFDVEPNAVHALEVTVRDHDPWRTEVRVGPDETRVFVVTPVAPKGKSAQR